jgi:hypothetical protein
MFVATFDHFEAESTAAVMVKVLAMNGDTWRTASCEELADGFHGLTKDEGPWRDRFNNPFVKIDMFDLVERGFAAWDGDRAIKFTEKGLERMRKWVAVRAHDPNPIRTEDPKKAPTKKE